MIVGGLVSGDREGVGRWVAGGGGRRPPAVLLSLPTAIEKVKHTPTRGHVTSREKDRVRELPSFLSPRRWHTYVTVYARRRLHIERIKVEDKEEGWIRSATTMR